MTVRYTRTRTVSASHSPKRGAVCRFEEEGDLFGSTVIFAARIAAAAQGGEVLASMAVRELCSGKGFLFADRGEFVAKGFEDPVRMFEVSWRL